MAANSFRALLLWPVLVAMFALSVLVSLSNSDLIKFLQGRAGVTNSRIYIGRAILTPPPEWFLRLSEDKGAPVRLYGIFPIPRWLYSNQYSGRQFSFIDESAPVQTRVTFLEGQSSSRSKETLALLDGTPQTIPAGCTIARHEDKNLDGLQCAMNDGVVVYMPRIGVTMFVDPSQGAVGKYAMALSIN